ncbi:bifunctional indole-3-glycerol phosphate synthase/phosphoribosylanthranilate isomerase [uncultured Treponema sp.]|uniref:bifunctional indole-3-glycerol phosphate synthase/phosphoribosylanthranilate isomerase n=1 Tax=uncultured Treponema sp. TaxID=162155 RepID=UPI0025D5D3F2|nr:bifunctional indole-3-glycerol phosphate synthase/phosphoribosylanthranilate isomerase [uncultured Treponema sp.]
MDILTEICEKRRADIKNKGFSFGHKIPQKRIRPVVPFLNEPGTILEIKRASPSKGWIAPELDASETAKNYVKAGTKAISCLTEENYFHGSLEDLQKAAKKAGKKASVLRKDFLLEPEEIEISYLCGADAVLLIGRILEQEKLLAMAKKAFEFGIYVLLEIREENDIKKAFAVLNLANSMACNEKIILGINSRDLANFTIDLLIPLKLKQKIRKIYKETESNFPFPRIISESGVTTPLAAKFVGNLGFHAVLIGEAAAKNPKNAKKLVKSFSKAALSEKLEYEYSFWKKISVLLEEKSEKPLIKVCGITSKEDAEKAAELGADILGFIFAEKSPRTNKPDDSEKIREIRVKLENLAKSKKIKKMPLLVGVIVDPFSEEGNSVYQMCYEQLLDGIQFHGCKNLTQGEFGYAAVPLAAEEDFDALKELYSSGFPRVLVDAKNLENTNADGDLRYGGTGKTIPGELIKKSKKLGPLWLSGGLNPENIGFMIKNFQPELIDVNSGVESEPGKKDFSKLEQFFSAVDSAVQ